MDFDHLTAIVRKSNGVKLATSIYDKGMLCLYPTIVTNVTLEGTETNLCIRLDISDWLSLDCVMHEELFGPVCDVIKAGYESACKMTKR